MTEQEESLSLTSIIECGYRGDSRWVAESRVQELEGELGRAKERTRKTHKAWVEKVEYAESRLARLEEALKEIAENYEACQPGRNERGEAFQALEKSCSRARNALTHSTPLREETE